ncbi:MAG: hypothetical protein AAGL98_12965, partial [Planctomycetota bacterium]
PDQPEAAKTDPQLDALLDEALAPAPGISPGNTSETAPAGLNDRILEATVDRLPGGRVTESNPVIGRISGGGFPWRRIAAFAAVLTLGVLIGRQYVLDSRPDRVTPFPGDLRTAYYKPLFPTLDDGLDQLADAALDAEPIDDEIAWLSIRLSATQTPGIWEQDALDSLDAAIAFEEFDELQDELDLYF